MKLRPRHALWLIPVALLVIPVWQWLTPKEPEPPRQGAPVVVAQPSRGDLEIILSYPGNLMAESTTMVVPKLGGKVEQILVKENQRVSQGTILVRIESDVARIQSEQAQAALQAAQAQLDKAIRGVRPEELESIRATVQQAEKDFEVAGANLARTGRLFDAGAVARVDFENAENQVQNAQTQLENAQRSLSLMEQGSSTEDVAMATANVNAAEKSYELAMLQLDFATVKAPVSGTVARIMAEVGNSVGVGSPLLAIINDDLIYANVAVPEKYYGEFMARRGLIDARVTPIAYAENPTLDGTVTSIAPVIDPESRTFNVEIAVENGTGQLRPGMFVNVHLVMNRVREAILVPTASILFRDNQSVVFLVNSDTEGPATMVPVETGISQGSLIQITTGIEPGDRLVTAGNAFLEDGQLVRIVSGQ